MIEEEYSLFNQETAGSKARFSLRRSHPEIRLDILSCVKMGAEKPTQIMYRANLSWTALKDHLSALEQSGLLAIVDYGNRKRYELPEKGMVILMAYRRILEQMKVQAERKAEVR